MKYLKYLVNITLLLVLMVSMMPSKAEGSTATLTVAANQVYQGTGGLGDWGGSYVGVPADYTGMNLDCDATSYWLHAGGAGISTWQMSGAPNYLINSITINVVASLAIGGIAAAAIWKDGSNHYAATVSSGTGTWATYSGVWPLNPSTGVAWTKSSIDALKFGLISTASYAITCVSVVVDYTYAPPSVTTIVNDAIEFGGGTQNTTLRGSLTAINGATPDMRGFAWGTTSNTTMLGTETPLAGGQYTSNWTEGASGTGLFNHNIGNLVVGTTYYYRAYAHNSAGWGWGNEMSFTSLSGTLITTLPVTNISRNAARLNSVINSDGGTSCTIRFLRGTVTGLYTSNTTVTIPTATYVAGNNPYLDVTGLVTGQVYYVRVEIIGEIDITRGAEVSFTTATSVNPPTALSGIPTSNTVSLLWEKGSGSDQTAIRYNIGIYPTSNITGVLGYLDTGSSTVITGLSPGTSYYFRAWGSSLGTYSTSNITLMVTTLAGSAATTTMPTPATPTGWLQAPDYTNMANTPFYSIVNFAADAFEMPRSTLWYMCALFFCVAVGVFFYSTVGNANLFLSVCAVGAMMIACSLMKLVPYWQTLPFVVFAAVGIFVGERR